MSTELILHALTAEQVDLLKRTICKDSTDDELALFISRCNRTGLDPFAEQIHAVKRWDRDQRRDVLKIQVGIAGLQLIAERTGQLDGLDGPYWCGPDGVWVEEWLRDEPPAAAKVLIYRKDKGRPRKAIARYTECVQRTKDGHPNYFWTSRPAHMLAKCAEAQALRGAFPNELSGLLTPEELGEPSHAPALARGVKRVEVRGPAKPDVPQLENGNGGTHAPTSAELDTLEKLLAATASDIPAFCRRYHIASGRPRDIHPNYYASALARCRVKLEDLQETSNAAAAPSPTAAEPAPAQATATAAAVAVEQPAAPGPAPTPARRGRGLTKKVRAALELSLRDLEYDPMDLADTLQASYGPGVMCLEDLTDAEGQELLGKLARAIQARDEAAAADEAAERAAIASEAE
jgi:phage recombination protein Bet